MTSDFTTLIVWREAHQLSLDIYHLTSLFPAEEKFGLTSQLKRACTSIELNISEGTGRSTDKDFIRFLYQALGSSQETHNLFLLLRDLHLIDEEQYSNFVSRITSIGKMLSKLISTRRKSQIPTRGIEEV